MFESHEQPSNRVNSTQTLPILGVAILLGFLFDFFLFGKIPGVGFTLFVAAVVLGTVLVSRSFKKPLSPMARWFAGLAVIFGLMVAVRASHELIFMNIVLSIFLLLLVVSEVVGEPVRTFTIERYVRLGWLPFYFLGNIGLYGRALFRQKNSDHHRTLGAVIRGIVLALPLLIIFALLFSSADLVFAKHVHELIRINVSFETLLRTFLMIMVTLIFLGALWYMFTAQRKDAVSTVRYSSTRMGRIEVGIILGSVNILFLLFIIVQLRYLFGGDGNVIGQGFTYAEYARRGFFELIVVTVISWLVVWTLHRTIAHAEGSVQHIAKSLSTTLIGLVFLIMTSAFMRLVLYEQAYGFTTMRFYSHVFIIWLGVIFVLLLYKLLFRGSERALATSLLMSILIFAAAVNLYNPDSFIARRNLNRYATTGKVDVFYFDLLSPDAIPTALSIIDAPDTEIARTGANCFYWKLQRLRNSQSKWQAFNISRSRATKLLEEKAPRLEENKDFAPAFDSSQQSTQSM